MATVIVEANPDAGDYFGGKAGEPGDGIVIVGARLAGRWSFKSEVADPTSGAAVDSLLQKVDDLSCEVPGDCLP